MSVQILILEDSDPVSLDDYCRPLYLTRSLSEQVFSTSTYSGKPINNLKWIKVGDIFGVVWNNKTVKEINTESMSYEFIRGNMPKSHLL